MNIFLCIGHWLIALVIAGHFIRFWYVTAQRRVGLEEIAWDAGTVFGWAVGINILRFFLALCFTSQTSGFWDWLLYKEISPWTTAAVVGFIAVASGSATDDRHQKGIPGRNWYEKIDDLFR